MSKIINGQVEKIKPNSIEYWVCCDCGLVHTYHFSYKKGLILVESYRNEWATKKERKKTQGRSKK